MRHRIVRVEGEVKQGQLKFARVDFDNPEIGRDVGLDSDICREGFDDQHRQVAKLPGEFDRLGVQRLLASKGEELPRQICAAFSCLPGGIQISPEPCDLRTLLRGEVEVSENDRQQIVEIVSDTAGDRADGLQPLALLKNSSIRRRSVASVATPAIRTGTPSSL